MTKPERFMVDSNPDDNEEVAAKHPGYPYATNPQYANIWVAQQEGTPSRDPEVLTDWTSIEFGTLGEFMDMEAESGYNEAYVLEAAEDLIRDGETNLAGNFSSRVATVDPADFDMGATLKM